MCDLPPFAAELAAVLDPECRVSPWRHVEGLPPFRIWICRTSLGWFQRHEWQVQGRNSTDMEDWIPSTRGFGSATLPPPETT